MSVRFRFVTMFDRWSAAVADRVPEVEHAVRPAEEAGPVHDVGAAVQDRPEQRSYSAGSYSRSASWTTT